MKLASSIYSWGVAIPRRRLANKTTASAWNQSAPPGARSVAGADEDSLTLAVEAALQALSGGNGIAVDKTQINALLFAGTTPPFSERSSAALIAEVLGLRPEIISLDLNSSLRCGTSAILAGSRLASAEAGSKPGFALVIAADTRRAEPGSENEYMFGHAGVALLIGPSGGGIAELTHYSCLSDSTIDTWQRREDNFPHSADTRFCRTAGYGTIMQRQIENILNETGWAPGEIKRVSIYSPDAKSGALLLKKNAFDPASQYCDPVSPAIGLTGSAHTLLMLAAALEKSSAGDKLLLLGYGDGADAFAAEVRRDVETDSFTKALSGAYDISYNRYLNISGFLLKDHRCSTPFASEIMSERNKELWYALKGKRCTTCNIIISLPLPACPRCKTGGKFETIELSRQGEVFAITHEHYFPTAESPLGMAVVDLKGGARMTLQVADENERLKIGDQVELVYRRLVESGNLPGYFWKCRKTAGSPQSGSANESIAANMSAKENERLAAAAKTNEGAPATARSSAGGAK